MYLADCDIRALLDQIQFETNDAARPFNIEAQLQPCSIDLRLDATFWRQHARTSIDLRKSKLLEMVPRRHWRKILLGAGESIKLRPGEMILGRTFEAFSIPRSCAGKLE